MNIKEFTQKWTTKFQDSDVCYIDLVDHYMADDCQELGFEMDCGHAFQERYGKAVYDVTELRKIIEYVSDKSSFYTNIMPRFEQKGALFERRLRLLGQSLLLTLIHAMSRGKNVGWGKFLEHSLCIFGGKIEKFANYRRRSPPVSPYRTLRRNYFEIIQQKISKTS